MKFTSAFTVVACAVAAQAATVATVLSNIATINTGVTNLNNLLQAYPLTGGTLANALAIHNAAAALVTPINTATTNVNGLTPLPVAVADYTSILDAVDAFKPTIVAALARIVVIKPAFVALPVGGLPALVKTDLNNLNAATSALETALIAKAPTTALTTRATNIQSTINSAFATAIAAYA